MPRQSPKPPVAENNRPVHEIRHRNLRAAIWKNQTEKGVMYDVHVTRGFRDGDKWRDSHSFGYDDLMNVAKLLMDAHSFITAAQAAEADDRRDRPSA
jgi:hypothetical protein